MRSGTRTISLLALVLALCAGCNHKQALAPPPPQAQAPTISPAKQMAAMIPLLPVMPPYESPLVILDIPPQPATANHARLRHEKHHSKSAETEAAQTEGPKPPAASESTPPASPQVAESGSSDVSPIGQLSTANDTANAGDRHAIIDLINSTENGLNEIKRPLSSSEQKTAAQIRTFITHARDSLKAGDLDGARTLATKAHLLLLELTQQ